MKQDDRDGFDELMEKTRKEARIAICNMATKFDIITTISYS